MIILAYVLSGLSLLMSALFLVRPKVQLLLLPEFHVNIKLSTFFSTGEEFLKNIPPEYHFKNKTHSFTSNWRRILGKLPIL